MSCGGRPARSTMALPSPVQVGRGAGEVDPAIAAGREHELRQKRCSLPSSRQSAISPRHAPSSSISRSSAKYSLKNWTWWRSACWNSVQERVAGAVGGGAGAVGLGLAVVGRLGRRRAGRSCLGRPRERHAVVLELDHRGGRVLGHVLDRVLVAQPIRAFDRIVHVKAPVVRPHVAERGVDLALGGDGVAAGRIDLRDAGCAARPRPCRPRRADPSRRRPRPGSRTRDRRSDRPWPWRQSPMETLSTATMQATAPQAIRVSAASEAIRAPSWWT